MKKIKVTLSTNHVEIFHGADTIDIKDGHLCIGRTLIGFKEYNKIILVINKNSFKSAELLEDENED